MDARPERKHMLKILALVMRSHEEKVGPLWITRSGRNRREARGVDATA
jgi:hypothetical protein